MRIEGLLCCVDRHPFCHGSEESVCLTSLLSCLASDFPQDCCDTLSNPSHFDAPSTEKLDAVLHQLDTSGTLTADQIKTLQGMNLGKDQKSMSKIVGKNKQLSHKLNAVLSSKSGKQSGKQAVSEGAGLCLAV